MAESSDVVGICWEGICVGAFFEGKGEVLVFVAVHEGEESNINIGKY